jgi:hypothetical protein
MKTQDIRDLVQEVLSTMKPPWPKGITDQVCIAIENNPEWLNTYYQLEGIHGRNTTNSNIGWYTRDITGLRNLHKTKKATSKLIKTYSELG